MEERPSKHLWLGNLNARLPRTSLKAYFEAFGPVDDVVTFPGRMYAFVNFRNPEDARMARVRLDDQQARASSQTLLLNDSCRVFLQSTRTRRARMAERCAYGSLSRRRVAGKPRREAGVRQMPCIAPGVGALCLLCVAGLYD